MIQNVDRSVLYGRTWLGIGRIRFYLPDGKFYTMWVVFITSKFAFGFHFGGSTKEPS